MRNNEAARTILLALKEHVVAGGNRGSFGDYRRAVEDIDALLADFSQKRAIALVAPTANLQEVSLDCGWGHDFNALAAQLEALWP
ncbi:MAG: hypothetical protein M3Y65_07870 [Pseudomonadota bacterium]|nr:hypothetical protein [Pseudomonadota bacterium]